MTHPLLDRLRSATGPDRELDRDLYWRFDERGSGVAYSNTAFGLPRQYDHSRPVPGGLGALGVLVASPPYTASLDAALGLVERTMKPGLLEVAGGWNPKDPEEWPAWTIRWYPAHVPVDGKSWHAVVETARTPALALLVTLLTALANKEAPDE